MISEHSNNGTITIHDLTINRQRRTVVRAGRPISLTAREFDLLEFLALNPGQLASRSMIWQRVYRKTERRYSNVIDVHIRHLRRKMDTGFSQRLIRTKHGCGYYLHSSEPAANPGQDVAGGD